MGFVLYRSSAGSGKTYTLVKEYLKIVLQKPERFKNILAVTFTNKAAGEMKDRIVLALQNLSAGKDPELEATLIKELGRRAPKDVKKSSADILTWILHNYSDFAIMTIDSFIHRVIKAFALEIGLPLNFGITLNYEGMETYVIENLLGDVGRDEFITGIILEFVFARIKAEKSWNIEGEIKRFEKEILSEKNIDWVQGLAALDNVEYYRLIEQLGDLSRGFVEALNEAGGRGLRLIEKAGLTINDFAYKKSGAAGFLIKCRDLKTGGLKSFTMSKRFLEGVWYSKSQDTGIRAAIEGLLQAGLTAIKEEISGLYDSEHGRALTALFASDNIYLTAVISRIKEQIDDYKEKNNLIPISEFNVRVYEIIKKAPIPFLYSILGEKYNHYLIDEFQDTSRLQFENLLPLFRNALGEGFFSMAVGDGKQSIYRWRGGDVEIMEQELQNRLPAGQLEIKRLHKNFRSSRNVVEFNNSFFAKTGDFYKEDNLLLEHIYGDTAQETVRKEGGFVSLRFIEAEAAPLSSPSTSPQVVGVFDSVIRIIEDCRKRGYEYNDIAILVRENREGREIAENLLQESIPVVSPDSLVLMDVSLVRFLIDVLTYLSSPEDKIAEAAIIYFILLNSKAPRRGEPIKKINKSFDQT
ncbi:MAG: UvrD-helicase domain-containing protein, partial [Candidatus Aminicenantes bacterium]|nr:UvrD-helicase domain-containing protein [Candidatus Aminicenantes bacterium]